MATHNEKRLFAASCISLLLTAMTFAIRARLETVFGPVGAGLTMEQIGYAFAPAFWGFTLAMVFGGHVVDHLGMHNGMRLAFSFHLAGILSTLAASGMTSLFVATLLIGLGNGMVEAVCNPLVASLYPREKTKKLNHFHLWWPAGIVTGAIIGYLVMDVAGASWQVMVASLFIPLVAYGYLFTGQTFPVTERVAMGVSDAEALKGLMTPLYLLVGCCMMVSAATELVTTQRIESMLSATGTNALLLLAFINGVMIIGRAYAGPISKRLSIAGMLFFSAIVSFIGLQLLAHSSGPFVFAAAAVFAIGVTLFWPTTLALIAESLPQTGAFGLAVMGGLGQLSVAFALPIMGRILDQSDGANALQTISGLPAILIVAYGGLFFYRRWKMKPATADVSN